MNKNSRLRTLNGFKAFYLGQLEGQYLEGMANRFCPSRSDKVIAASAHFNFDQKLSHNYSYISKNKDNAEKIADYLCAINWLSHFYAEFERNIANPRYVEILKNFYLADEKAYFTECADFYSFAYDYLNEKFYNDPAITDAIKTRVYSIND